MIEAVIIYISIGCAVTFVVEVYLFGLPKTLGRFWDE